MRPSKGSIKREYSHLTENWEVFQYDSRLMRRLKRRSIASKMMEHNHSAIYKRKNVESCGDKVVKNAENHGHILVEEVDEDYRFFLDEVDFHVDVVSDKNIIASDVDVNTGHGSDNGGDTDAQHKGRMGPSKGSIKREYSHLTENLEVFQYDSRLMRRLKRRSIASEMIERHYNSNAKRKNVGRYGDEVVKNAENIGNVLEEEVDLGNVGFHVDVISDNNIIDAHIDVSTSHGSDNDGHIDAQYKMLLENLREDGKSYILKVFVDNQLFCVRYEGQEERFHDLVNSEVQCVGDDEHYQLFLNSSRMLGDNLVCMPKGTSTIKYGGSESEGKSSEVRKNLQDPFQVIELPNSIQASDDCRVAKSKHLSEVLSDVADEDWQIYLNSEVRKNLQVLNEATEPPKARQVSDVYHVDEHNNEVQCGIDEDYELFLNSLRLDGDSLICMPERDITIKYGASESKGERSNIRQNLQVPFEVTEVPNSRQALDDFHVAKKKRPSEVLSDGVDEDLQIYLNSFVRKNSEEKPSAARWNLEVSNEATGTPNSGQASDDYRVARNKRPSPSEVLSDVDEDWKIYLNSEARRKSEAKPSAVRQNLQVSNEATELPNAGQASDDYCVAKNNNPSEVLGDVDEDWQIYLNSEVGRKSEAKCSAVRQNLPVSDEATEPPNAGHASDDYHVVNSKRPSEALSGDVDEDWQTYLNSDVWKNLEETCSEVRQNLQVSNKATELPSARQDLSASQCSHVVKDKCNSIVLGNMKDENYQLFLKSVRTDGDNLIYMPENDVTVVYGEECDQSSSDSEPIILDPSQHYEYSPSICSQSYHLSCLADERNHKDGLYRKGLMEELERPYNQKELDKLLQVASHERLKELHREMRHGVTKDRPKGGDDNKTSYLKMHGGLERVINQVKEPQKVLFLLRGFFYWLKHVPQRGAFRPWLDASCLKMLQKL